MASQAQSKTSSDHEEIRRWAETREGIPSCVKGTGEEGDIGMIRIDFPGYSGEDSLQHISWDEWFEKFDERNLALLYQETTAGGAQSNFNKLVSRETAQESESKSRGKRADGKRPAAKKPASKKQASGKKAGGSKKTAASGKREAQKSVAKKTASKSASKKSASSSNRKSASKGASRKATKKSASKRSR